MIGGVHTGTPPKTKGQRTGLISSLIFYHNLVLHVNGTVDDNATATGMRFGHPVLRDHGITVYTTL